VAFCSRAGDIVYQNSEEVVSWSVGAISQCLIMEANAASLASSTLSSSSSALKQQSLCFKRWFKRPFRCLRNSTRFENRGMLSCLPVSVPVSMRITTTTHCEHPNKLLVELVVESNEPTIDRSQRPIVKIVATTIALLVVCFGRVDALCCPRKNVWSMHPTLKFASFQGVLNMYF